MARKDRRAESHRNRGDAAHEVSAKATSPGIFDRQGAEGQTRGSSERGPMPGPTYDKAPGHYTDRGTASGN